MGAISSTLSRLRATDNQIDYLGFDRNDYRSMLAVKKWELADEDSKIVNASFRNFRINVYRNNRLRQEATGYSSVVPSNTENRIIAKDLCKKLQKELEECDWLLLMKWFLKDYEVTVDSNFCKKISKIKKRCKQILACTN